MDMDVVRKVSWWVVVGRGGSWWVVVGRGESWWVVGRGVVRKGETFQAKQTMPPQMAASATPTQNESTFIRMKPVRAWSTGTWNVMKFLNAPLALSGLTEDACLRGLTSSTLNSWERALESEWVAGRQFGSRSMTNLEVLKEPLLLQLQEGLLARNGGS
jgi:hypothetical protein